MLYSALTAGLCILFALAIKPVTDKVLIPYPAIMVLLGFIGSELLVHLGIDTGIRYNNFNTLISTLFIPTILFNTALSFDEHILREDRLILFYLPTITFGLTLLITTVLIYYGINHPSGFPWEAAFLTASLLTATSVRAMSDLLRHAGISLRMLILLESESLITNVLAVSLFSFLLMVLTHPQTTTSVSWLIHLILLFILPLFLGFFSGLLARFFLRNTEDNSVRTASLLVFVYGLYSLSQSLLPASGALSVFVFGLCIKNWIHQHPFLAQYWRANTLIATLIMYFLLGATITAAMFHERWLAMLIGIFSLLCGRIAGIFPGLTLLSKTNHILPVTIKEQTLLTLCGTRGALTIALAFMLPETLDYWWTIQAIAFGVVIFSVFVQAPLAAWWQRLIVRSVS
ncbi:cation:proton antiporter [Fluoribacter gormanii]|uniref:cation:proton antiporter domain-containing protein n=1 Tax=Fluoribacter gormanii TaxID=464 RepID=UPI0022433AA1|nr:cation:proton antiporter [Fluoribacter gormanii]MCW8443133.1 cation:proton antiporter [Fluoribacter gormanii]